MLSTLLNQSKLVYWPLSVGQSNMHIRLDFCHRLPRMETNVAILKRTEEPTVLIYLLCLGWNGRLSL